MSDTHSVPEWPPASPGATAPPPQPALRATADGLAAVAALRNLADQMEDAEVERAMREGWSWSEVAMALGVSRQAVHRKHLRRLIDAGIELRRRNG